MPVWIVIALLRTLVATPLAIVVLAGIDSRISIQSSVGGEKSHVPLTLAAVEVVVIILVHAELQVRVAVEILTLSMVFGNSAV